MVESAPLLREYTLIAYRGFESLSLRQTKKKGPRKAGLFFWSGGERGRRAASWFDKSRSDLDRRRRPEGVETRDAIAFRVYPVSLRNGHRSKAGLFFGLAEREGKERPRGSTNCEAVWTAAGAPVGGQDARCNRVLSLSLHRPPRYYLKPPRGFFWSGGERCPGENPWFDKLRSSLDRKTLRAFSAYGTSLCLTAAGAFRPYGSPKGSKREMPPKNAPCIFGIPHIPVRNRVSNLRGPVYPSPSLLDIN